MASKFEAFNNRGGDYRTSHDFEDIIYVLDNRTIIVSEIKATQEEARRFLKSEIKRLLNNPYHEEIIAAHIHPLIVGERYPLILEKMQHIIKD